MTINLIIFGAAVGYIALHELHHKAVAFAQARGRE